MISYKVIFILVEVMRVRKESLRFIEDKILLSIMERGDNESDDEI